MARVVDSVLYQVQLIFQKKKKKAEDAPWNSNDHHLPSLPTPTFLDHEILLLFQQSFVLNFLSVYLNSNFTLIYPNFLNITLSVSDDWNSEQPCTDISLWIIIFIYYYRQFKNHLDMLKCVLYFELRLLFNLLVS